MDFFVNSLLFLYLFSTILLSSCTPSNQPPIEGKSKLIPTQSTPAASQRSHQSPIADAVFTKPITKKIDGLKLKTMGPNCWNGALIKSGLVHSVRFVPKGEYWFWMNSPYCRKLSNTEEPKKGDLGSLFWNNRGHYHSFVYLDSKWVFSKNSPDPKFKYKVQAFEEMFQKKYSNKARKCWNDYHIKPKLDCEFDVEFHRCHPIEEGFFNTDSKLKAWDQLVKPLEMKVFSWITEERTLSLFDFEIAIEKLYLILSDVQKELSFEINKIRKFKLEALEYRLMGLILSDINIASTSKKLNPIINKIYKLQSTKAPKIVLKKPNLL